MLRSYRLHTGNKYPFAILCEEENEYTKKFDKVILLKDCHRDYRDKFRLLTDCPFDENFFIEPDCLIYNDISFFWGIFSNATDFSSFGWNDGKIDTWTLTPQLIKEKLQIDQIPIFCPGYLFIRNGDICVKKLYKTVLEICDFINSNDALANDTLLHCGKNLRDDPIFSFAMAAIGCSCQQKPRIGKCIYLPGVTKISQISLLDRTLNLTYYKETIDNCSLLHFTSKKLMRDYTNIKLWFWIYWNTIGIWQFSLTQDWCERFSSLYLIFILKSNEDWSNNCRYYLLEVILLVILDL